MACARDRGESPDGSRTSADLKTGEFRPTIWRIQAELRLNTGKMQTERATFALSEGSSAAVCSTAGW